MPDQENVQLQNDPVVSGAEAPVVESQTPELDDAALDAQFQSFLTGEETQAESAEADASLNDTADAATSGDADQNSDSEAADDATADAEVDPFAEIREQGRQLKESEASASKQSDTTAQTQGAGDAGTNDAPPSNKGEAEPPRLQTAQAEINWDQLPKVVMVGDQPHNLKSVYDRMTQDYEDDAILPLLTYVLSQASQKSAPDSILANKFTEFQQQVSRALQARDQALESLQYRAYLGDIAQAGAPEVFEIDANPDHPFWKDLAAMDEETQIFFEAKRKAGDPKGVAKVISAWRQSVERAKVAAVDSKRAEKKEKVDTLLRSTTGDRTRNQSSVKGPGDELTDAEADAVFQRLLAEV